MSDTVLVALIMSIPGTIGAFVGVMNAMQLGRVEKNVDGNLTEIKSQLATVTAERLTLTKKSAHAEGVLQEKEGNGS